MNKTDEKTIPEIMKPYRARIDILDEQILDLLRKRIDVIEEVAVVKSRENLHPVLQDRVEEVRENAKRMARARDLDDEFIGDIYAQLIKHCCDMEERLMDFSDNDTVRTA